MIRQLIYEQIDYTMKGVPLFNKEIRAIILLRGEVIYSKELIKDINFSYLIQTSLLGRVIHIVKDRCDTFLENEVHRPDLSYEFSIEIGDNELVYCQVPSYSIYIFQVMIS